MRVQPSDRGAEGTIACGIRRPVAWFDARVSDDEARIAELERGFRRDGLPNLILDFSAAEDVFTRAIPFLSLVFVLEVVNAMDVDAEAWQNLLYVLGGAAILFGAFGMLNIKRGRPFLTVPSRVGRPSSSRSSSFLGCCRSSSAGSGCSGSTRCSRTPRCCCSCIS